MTVGYGLRSSSNQERKVHDCGKMQLYMNIENSIFYAVFYDITSFGFAFYINSPKYFFFV